MKKSIYKQRIVNAIRLENKHNMLKGKETIEKKEIYKDSFSGTGPAVLEACLWFTDEAKELEKKYSNIYLDIIRTEFNLTLDLGVYI